MSGQAVKKQLKIDITAANLKWSAVEKLLPEWHREALQSSSGILELKAVIARQFGLRLSPEGSLIRPSTPHKALYKIRANTKESDVAPAQAVARSVARIVVRATCKPYAEKSIDAAELRSSIIDFSPKKWVSFECLVDQCWDLGIPVVYLSEFPTKGKKMDGMVTQIGKRPVIVLSRKDDADWMLFILAHELGHIACRHLEDKEDGTILDEAINDGDQGDREEGEANSFASNLITPHPDGIYLRQLMKAPDLAAAAIEYGIENNISPGHVILSAARNTKVGEKPIWALAKAAIKHLPKEIASRPVHEICAAALAKNVAIDQMKSDDVEFLENLKVL